MKKIVWSVVIGLILPVGAALALEVTSLAPTRGAPGVLVAIGGGPFTTETEVFLGEAYVPPRSVLANQIEFTVPFLPAGRYALTVQDRNSVARESYRFEVLAPTPEITGIDPDTLDICTPENEHRLTVNGRNFLPGATVLLDSTAVPTRVVDVTSLDVRLPRIKEPGIHGVSVRNPDGTTSLPRSLAVNNVPEIFSVERGPESVNSYEVLIHGKNFQFDSTLVVREPDEATFGQTSQQLSFAPRRTVTAGEGFENLPPQRNHLVFVDCRTLIYHRLPSSFQDKELGLQIFNPDGGHTELMYVVLP